MTIQLDFRIPHSLFRIPYSAPHTRFPPGPEHFTTSVRSVLGNMRVSRYSFHGYTDTGNTRE